MCADRPSDLFFRKVLLRNSSEAIISDAVAEHASIVELTDGSFGPQGVSMVKLLYRHCVGEPVTGEEMAELIKWGILQEDGTVSQVKRDVVLSICKLEGSEICLEESPFVRPEDVADAKAIASMDDEYFRQTFVRMVRAAAVGKTVHKEFLEHAYAQAMKIVYPDYDRSDLPWAERLRRGDGQQEK
jgi:hypothetical protein